MNEQKKTSPTMPTSSISEAERMAKIRELLVGPVIADQSARVDESFDRLDELVKEQQETIRALQSRVQALEDHQRAGMREIRTRLLGMAEALLADDDDVRTRLEGSEILKSSFESCDDDGA